LDTLAYSVTQGHTHDQYGITRLGTALGLDDAAAAAIPAMGDHLPKIKEYLRGTNPRITSADAMVKTTPPGRGSRLLRPGAPTRSMPASPLRWPEPG
jgi:CO dehydrogenase maturation factor